MDGGFWRNALRRLQGQHRALVPPGAHGQINLRELEGIQCGGWGRPVCPCFSSGRVKMASIGWVGRELNHMPGLVARLVTS